MILTKREAEILAAIVEIYVDTAQPVGWQTVIAARGLSLSPASVRATMAVLTEKGYVLQPHTSAGRVPSVQGFRYYLDQVLRFSPLSRREQSRLQDHILPGTVELPETLRRAAAALASLTRQLCVITAPRHDLARWRHIDFVLLHPGRVMAVLVMHGGLVSNRVLDVDTTLDRDELLYYSNYLNSLLEGRTTSEVRQEIIRQLRSAQQTLDAYGQAWELAEQAIATDDQPELFVGGASHLTDHPEFTDLTTLHRVLELIEERTRLLELLDKTQSSPVVSVSLGQDMPDLLGCSLVASAYSAHYPTHGSLAVLGPVRMNYARILPMVDFAAQVLSQCLTSRF